MYSFPSIWNGLTIGGGGATNSFTTIQTDVGTSPVASSPTDTLSFTTSDPSLAVFDGDAIGDRVTLNLDGIGSSFVRVDGTSIMTGGLNVQNSLGGAATDVSAYLAPTWNTTGDPIALFLDITNTASGAASRFVSYTLSGSNIYYMDKNGQSIQYLKSRGVARFASIVTPDQFIEIVPDDSGTVIKGGTPSADLIIAQRSTRKIHFVSQFVSGTTNTMANFDGQTGAFALTPFSLTGSGAFSAIDLTQTWNTTGTPDMIKITLTDTASNTASNIFKYIQSGSNRVILSKNGSLNIDASTAGVSSITVGYDGGLALSGSVGNIKRDATLGLGVSYQVATSYINGHVRRPVSNWTTTSGAVYLGRDEGTFAPTSGTATFTTLMVANVINQTGGANGITRGVYINPTLTAAADYRALEITAGKIFYASTNTAGGTTGAQTINKISGTVNFAAAATTLVVTNNLVTAASIIFCVVRTNDTTATIKNVVPAAGSFTITLGAAATAETSVGFMVIN